jgi:hypothetical protein
MKISNFLWDLGFPNPLKRGWSLNVFLVQFVKLAWCVCFVFPRYRSIHLFIVDSAVFVWEVPPITEALKMLALIKGCGTWCISWEDVWNGHYLAHEFPRLSPALLWEDVWNGMVTALHMNSQDCILMLETKFFLPHC